MLCRCLLATVVLMASSTCTSAQSVPTAVPPAPLPMAAPIAPPAPGGIVGTIVGLEALCKAKKEKCCKTPLGLLFANLTRPMTMMTGGLIPSCCATTTSGPSPADMAAPGPVGAAAKIQQEEAEAKARRAAVKYLATVDCHYYPEAEAMLVLALRSDRNECVRWEAAHALTTGCCCTKNTIEALTLTVTGSEKDGHPAENSPRVRMEAYLALQNCLANRPTPAPTPPERPIQPEQATRRAAGGAGIMLTSYYAQLREKPASQILADAQRAVAQDPRHVTRPMSAVTGQRNLLALWEQAKSPDQPQSARDEEFPRPQPMPVQSSLERTPSASPPGNFQPGPASILMPPAMHGEARGMEQQPFPPVPRHAELMPPMPPTNGPPGNAAAAAWQLPPVNQAVEHRAMIPQPYGPRDNPVRMIPPPR